MRVLRSAVGLLLLQGACQDYLFEQKCAERISEQEIARSTPTPRPSDILFVVDDSGSMADEQLRLAANFDAFIAEISQLDHDYRIGVITTDLTNATNFAGTRDYGYSDMSTYRHVYSNDQSQCVRTNVPAACFRGPAEARRVIESTMSAEEQITAFGQNVTVGSCGAGDEKGLAALVRALEQTGTDDCNEGFIRENANLVVIFVSDEEDVSGGEVGTWVDQVAALKPIGSVRVAAVVGFDGQDAASCTNGADTCGSLCDGPPPPAGSGAVCSDDAACTPEIEYCDIPAGMPVGACESLELLAWNDAPWACSSCAYFDVEDCCSAQAGSRYVEFAREVEARIAALDIGIADRDCSPAGDEDRAACLLDSVCQDSFAATLQRIARDLVISNEFEVEPPPPDPEAVTVRVSGGRFGEGKELVLGEDYAFADMNQRIRLDPEYAPREDETLDIFYVVGFEDAKDMPRGACGI